VAAWRNLCLLVRGIGWVTGRWQGAWVHARRMGCSLPRTVRRPRALHRPLHAHVHAARHMGCSPPRTIRRALSTAPSTPTCAPPSLKLSGVTFRMPMTWVDVPSSQMWRWMGMTRTRPGRPTCRGVWRGGMSGCGEHQPRCGCRIQASHASKLLRTPSLAGPTGCSLSPCGSGTQGPARPWPRGPTCCWPPSCCQDSAARRSCCSTDPLRPRTLMKPADSSRGWSRSMMGALTKERSRHLGGGAAEGEGGAGRVRRRRAHSAGRANVGGSCPSPAPRRPKHPGRRARGLQRPAGRWSRTPHRSWGIWRLSWSTCSSP